MMNGDRPDDDGGVSGSSSSSSSGDGDTDFSPAAVNYKTRKRPVTTVYTITGNGTDHGGDSCSCCVHQPESVRRSPVVGNRAGQQLKPRPRTWTCGTGLSRSRTFTSNYERAISSLLWQPYECRSSTNSLNDDGDVAVWLNATGRYEPLSSRSSLSLSTIPRSEGSCSSSVCRLLDDGGGYDRDKTPSSSMPCWCSSAADPDTAAAAGRTSTGYRVQPHGALPQHGCRGAVAACPPPSRRTPSNVKRPSSVSVWPRGVYSVGAVGASDWCCDNVVCDEQDDDDVDEDEDYDEPVDRDGVDRSVRVVMNNPSGNSLVMHGGGVVVDTTAVGRPPSSDAKPSSHPAAERTYASTEAQTDETACSSAYREQRRRERRERRQQQRRVHPPPPPPPLPPVSMAVPVDHRPDRLPDLLLNSHLPPPLYTTVGGGCDVAARANLQAALLPTFQHPHHLPAVAPGPVGPAVNTPGGFRLPFGFIPTRRRRSLHYCSEEDTPKSCCGLLTLPDATSTVSIRWFIGIVFVAGICSALVGTVLGATRASGREHLTVALLMIGVGVILVAISGIAWRLTAGHEASSCGAVFGLGRSLDDATEANRRFVPRLPPSYGRPHHPYAAMIYPEFEYRAPPPSYQASMQEYRLRLLLLDRQTSMPPVTASPPPTYRSQPGTLIRGQNPCCRDPGDLYLYQPSALINPADYSGPPSYRSRTSTMRPGCHLIDPVGSTMGSHNHSRNPSQLSSAMSEAVGGGGGGLVAVDNKVPVVEDGVRDIVVVDEKPDHHGGSVTIVQTSTTGPPSVTRCNQQPSLANNGGTVVVTVSGVANDTAANVRCRETEMEILAHL
ncbi:uncharacterized protein LOC126839088 [Adelges cooleyi]|uniref:uncharacterized protein LOC126839088 n=1 Tax=Adelges cooleyi TaxID=133065 RepID=UPI00217FC351|nr:uncharacterized protein LOC126839088 [Adelges cooleyi]XP_050430050.1 uncharacterized protein LOC126839088 [Adelges cooleyi]